MKRKERWLILAATMLYAALALVYLRPVWSVWQDRIAPGTEDSLFNLWVLKWSAHQLRLGLPDLWDANIYWPTRGTLALSDHLLGPALQLVLFEAVVPNAIAGYNFLFFTSFVLTGLVVCWVMRRSGVSWIAAVLAGVMYAFSPFRISQLNHIQILLAQWVPLTLWFWDRLLAERKVRHAVLFLVFYLLNVSGGAYLAYMVHIPMLVLLANRAAVHGRELVDRRSLRVLLPVGVVALAALALVFLPYVRIGREMGLTRGPAEAGKLGATTLSWLAPARSSLWFGPVAKSFMKRRLGPASEPFFRTENSLFAGIVPSLLAGVGLWAAWRRKRVPPSPLDLGRKVILGLLLALAAAAWIAGDVLTLLGEGKEKVPPWTIPAWTGLFLGGVASLAVWAWLRWMWGCGPVLRWREMDPWTRGLALSAVACFALAHPIAYVPMMRVLPGLDGMRVPARFAAFVSLAAVLFAAKGLDFLLDRLRTRPARLALVGVLSLVLAAELAPRPVRWARLEREEAFPEVYHWLAGRQDVRSLIEFPVRPTSAEIVYMYYSTLHWKPIANGYSGYHPKSFEALTARMRLLPDAAGLDLLEDLWITHLVVHTKAFQGRMAMLRRWEKEYVGSRLELIHDSGEARVYRLNAAAEPSAGLREPSPP
ncbi:MAG: hypothetical protein ABUT39_13030 [Acidobacteriota bacterium]